MRYDPKMIEVIRKTLPNMIAKEITDVQPIPNDAIKSVYENSLSKEELEKQNYKPVSEIGLLWIKDKKN